MLFSFFIDGFAFAGEALAGKYHGRGSQTSLRTLVNELMRIGLYFAIIFTALYILGGEWFMAMLAEDKNVVSIAAAYLPWAAAVPLCGFAAFIFDGIFVGLTRTRQWRLQCSHSSAYTSHSKAPSGTMPCGLHFAHISP
jgi:MATE family multidrug resistance protein